MSDAAVTRTQMHENVERLRACSYTLEVTDGPDRGKKLTTRARCLRIGTSPDNEFEVNDGLTSRFHARIEVDPLGHRLIDNDSKNGTLIGDLRVRDAYLTPGCLLVMGGNRLRFQPGTETVEHELSRSNTFGKIIGGSAAMREIFAILERVAPTDLTVLVEGESGTGKELIADALHQQNTRRDGPLVVFDCSAVAANLIESELFGHVKGAFTGATANRAGAFERAAGGTLLLDEIGELPLDLQPKLLRALEDEDATVRIEAADFRQDLYYRLAVIRLILPPLRRRVEDIPLLVAHFVSDLTPAGSEPVQVGYDTIVKLQKHRWPGNIRELRNFVERASMLTTGNRLETKFLLPPTFGDTRSGEKPAADESPVRAMAVTGPAVAEFDDSLPFKDAKARLIDTFERAYWSRLLDRTRGNISAAARVAGIHRKSAEYLLKKLNLRGASDDGPDDAPDDGP